MVFPQKDFFVCVVNCLLSLEWSMHCDCGTD